MDARDAAGANGIRRSVALLGWFLQGVLLVTILVTAAVGTAGPASDGRVPLGGTASVQTTVEAS
jgi:hypothetical protein